MNTEICQLQLLAKTLNNPNVLTFDGLATLMDHVGVCLEKEELLPIFSIAYGKSFVGYMELPTLMKRRVSRRKSYSFDVEELYEEIHLLVAYTIDAEIDSEHEYSTSEIQALLDAQKIIVMQEYALDCSYDEIKREPYQSFGHFDMNRMFDKSSPFYSAWILYLKDSIDFTELMPTFKKMIQGEEELEQVYIKRHRYMS